MRLTWLLAALPLGALAIIDGCSSEVECEVKLTCACDTDAQCERRNLDGVDECNAASCQASGQCGVDPLAAGTPCSVGACDGVGTCVPDGQGGSGATAGGGAGGAGGVGGMYPDYPAGAPVAAGGVFSCAIVQGAVSCWGTNDEGQLGIGSIAALEPSPKPVNLPHPALEITAGAQHGCARLADGSVWCWGHNIYGQVGDGTFQRRRDPVEVTGIDPVVQIMAAHFSTYALHEDGTVSSWGFGTGLGNGSSPGDDSAIPVTVNVSGVLRLQNETCAQLSNGDVTCWGAAPGYLPSVVSYPSNVVATANKMLWGSGSEAYMCVVNAVGGQVRCRGSNFCGVIGLGQATSNSPTFTALNTAADIEEIACSGSFCLARNAGTTYFWGTLVPALCEDDGLIDSYVPVPLTIGGTVTNLAVGTEHACVLTDDETVYCWGSNQYGTIGNGSTGGVVTTPTAVGGL